jgi:hypothetical protein
MYGEYIYKSQDLNEDDETELDENGVPVRRLSSIQPRGTAFVKYGANHRVFAVIKEQGMDKLQAALPSVEAIGTAIDSLTEIQTVLKGSVDAPAMEAIGYRLDAVLSLIAPDPHDMSIRQPISQADFVGVVKEKLTGLMTEAAGHSMELGDRVGALRDDLLAIAATVDKGMGTGSCEDDEEIKKTEETTATPAPADPVIEAEKENLMDPVTPTTTVETVAAATAPAVETPAAVAETPAPAPAPAAPVVEAAPAPSYVTKEDLSSMKSEILEAVKGLIKELTPMQVAKAEVVAAPAPIPAPIQVAPASTVPIAQVDKSQAGRVSSVQVMDMASHPALKDMDFNGNWKR